MATTLTFTTPLDNNQISLSGIREGVDFSEESAYSAAQVSWTLSFDTNEYGICDSTVTIDAVIVSAKFTENDFKSFEDTINTDSTGWGFSVDGFKADSVGMLMSIDHLHVDYDQKEVKICLGEGMHNPLTYESQL